MFQDSSGNKVSDRGLLVLSIVENDKKSSIGYFILKWHLKNDKSPLSVTFYREAELKPFTKINNSEELGQYILKERKRLKLTQKEISEFTDVGKKYVLELEKGKSTAQIGKIFEVLNGLGLELHLIKRGES